MQNSEYNQFLHDIAQARMSNKLKEYYFKVASLCRFKKKYTDSVKPRHRNRWSTQDIARRQGDRTTLIGSN